MNADDIGEWAHQHFGCLDLGDARRTARGVAMAQGAARRPGGRVLDVYRTSAQRQGAYDFLENTAVRGDAMVDGIGSAVASNCQEHPYVLVSVDASSLNIVDRNNTKGFGVVGNISKSGRGLKVVTAYALAADGTPVGVLDQQWWLRDSTKKDVALRHRRTTEEKETRYFHQAIEQSSRRLEQRAAGTRAWFLLDRESDRRATIELVHGMDQHWFTIRSNYNRRILNRWERSGPLHHRRIFREAKRRRFVDDALGGVNVRGRFVLDVPARPGREARRAVLSVRVAKPHVWLYSQRGPASTVQMTLVEARETRTTPRGEQPLHWRLWTNYPVTSFDDAKLVIETYAKRWRIEDFHKTWKSGACNVEDCQLRSPEAAIKWATLMASVAARIERLKHRSRTEPSLPASVELSEHEIQALILLKRRYKKKTETIPDDMPTLAQAVIWLAEIGGYTGPRVSGGPPGTITIRRGLEHIQPAALILESVVLQDLTKKR
jgi:Transposase DNA-binding/Transposase DDE domain